MRPTYTLSLRSLDHSPPHSSLTQSLLCTTGANPFPYAAGQEPPAALRDSQVGHLLATMGPAGVGGALLVQPINHRFYHSYLTSVLRDPAHGGVFKGMALLDPSCDDDFLPSFRREDG